MKKNAVFQKKSEWKIIFFSIEKLEDIVSLEVTIPAVYQLMDVCKFQEGNQILLQDSCL